jgi:PiT family inorganic phosphate transporter
MHIVGDGMIETALIGNSVGSPATVTAEVEPARAQRPHLDAGHDPRQVFLFFGVLGVALLYVAYSLYSDVITSGAEISTAFPFVLLGVALVIALGFEFVNGFHDTANAVATVIYTHSMPPHVAVVWSGLFNFLGVLASSGAVAYGIVALLPVELILKVGSTAGFAMVFALLLGAIIWNLGTWYFGLPASSSHTLIGSIIGVGLANQLMAGASEASGVDWGQAAKIGYSLLLSPLIGFGSAALLLLTLKVMVRKPELYQEPKGTQPPPFWVRSLLVLTCTGVSFAHGSNDGQKGMGLIMLILIGVVPTAYALNRTMPDSAMPAFVRISASAAEMLDAPGQAAGPNAGSDDGREVIGSYLRMHIAEPRVRPALAALSRSIETQISQYGSLRQVPAASVQNVRNDMYLASEAIRHISNDPAFSLTRADVELLSLYKQELDGATRFIPLWVKVAVAIALGLGTMVGWKRIVITVGEKIGKSHLTYGQGMSAELVAAVTIAAADMYGMPVSTTHVLSSGVAGTMAASGSGLQMATVRNMLMAWILTLPVAILLAGGLYMMFAQLF